MSIGFDIKDPKIADLPFCSPPMDQHTKSICVSYLRPQIWDDKAALRLFVPLHRKLFTARHRKCLHRDVALLLPEPLCGFLYKDYHRIVLIDQALSWLWMCLNNDV